jgi:hypothetical protein
MCDILISGMTELSELLYLVLLFVVTLVSKIIYRRMSWWVVNTEVERIWKEVIVAWSRYYPGVCLVDWRKSWRPQDIPYSDGGNINVWIIIQWNLWPLERSWHSRAKQNSLVHRHAFPIPWDLITNNATWRPSTPGGLISPESSRSP